MDNPRTDQPAPHAGEKEKPAGPDGNPAPQAPKDADSPASKPQGTLQDQVKTMESEGQAQPQSDEVPPEERETNERPAPDGTRVVRPDSEKWTGHAPPEDIDGGPEGATHGDKGGTG